MATGGQTDSWSEECIVYHCSVCETKKTVTNADQYCLDCIKYLCDSCVHIHNTLIDEHEVLPLTADTIKKIVTEKCEKHPKKVIKYFCRQHDALLCNTCKKQDHKQCEDPQNIRESSDELSANPEIQAIPAKLKSALEGITKAIQALDKHVAFIQRSGNSFLKDLEDFAKKLLSRIEELKEMGTKDINRKQEEILSVAIQHQQAFALSKDEINQYLDKIKESNKWKANLFVLKKKGLTLAQKIDALHNESDIFIKGHNFSFMTDMVISDSLNGFNSLVKKVGKRQINICVPDDKNICSIKAVCHLSDGSVVIVDSGNRRLKRIDPSRSKVTKYCDIDVCATDVCCIGPQEIAVAFNSDKVHVHCAVCLSQTRTVELGHRTYGIACQSGLLYATCGSVILYINDLSDGRKLRQINYKYTEVRNLFYNNLQLHSIAVNGSGDRMYVTGKNNLGLLCVNTDGQVIFYLSPTDLGLSRAICLTADHPGHVFVCGSGSKNVVKVTEDGHVVGEILSQKDWIICSPSCLSYDVSRSQLYIGGNSDQLLMVALK